MADSDDTTTLPFVTRADERVEIVSYMRAGESAALAGAPLSDPAARLTLKWIEAHAMTQALCIEQQKLELYVDGGEPQNADELRRNYAAALRAEDVAAATEQAHLDSPPGTPAQTINGIIGKLTMILGECEDNTDATDFPGPHILSVLDDLMRIAGQGPVPVEVEARGSGS